MAPKGQMICQEPREFNLFLQTQLRWNQRTLVKSNVPSINAELVDVSLKENKSEKLWLINLTIY